MVGLLNVVVVVVEPTLVSSFFPDLFKGLDSLKLTADSSAKCVVITFLAIPSGCVGGGCGVTGGLVMAVVVVGINSQIRKLMSNKLID